MLWRKRVPTAPNTQISVQSEQFSLTAFEENPWNWGSVHCDSPASSCSPNKQWTSPIIQGGLYLEEKTSALIAFQLTNMTSSEKSGNLLGKVSFPWSETYWSQQPDSDCFQVDYELQSCWFWLGFVVFVVVYFYVFAVFCLFPHTSFPPHWNKNQSSLSGILAYLQREKGRCIENMRCFQMAPESCAVESDLFRDQHFSRHIVWHLIKARTFIIQAHCSAVKKNRCH